MSVSADILKHLAEKGPMNLGQIVDSTRHRKKTVSSKLYDLRRDGKVVRSPQGFYEAVAPAPDEDAEEESPRVDSPDVRDVRDTRGGKAQANPLRQPISGDQERFRALLQDCDVKRALDTITETFFSGDPEDLDHLASVLDDARAYVSPGQKRMVCKYWARYIGRDIPPPLEERLNRLEGDRPPGSPRAGSQFVGPEDIGWKVEKDKDGDFLPRPGGELSYEKALKYAATMNATRTPAEDQEDAGDDEGEVRGKRRRKPLTRDPLVSLLIERAFPEKSSQDEELRLMRERLEKMEQERNDERLDRLEARLALALNRDPVEELVQMRQRLELIEGPRPVATDGAPTVQLIKDQTDKIDKNMNRVIGVLERAVLRNQDEVVAEEHSTPAEREARADRLVKQMDQANRSVQLRKEVFGR